jgi:uncharacterized protein (TIGR02145 family)
MKNPSISLLLGAFLSVFMLSACTDGDRLSVAEVSTNVVSYITNKSAVCGGKITSSPGSTISEKGICWSINPNPTKENDFVAMGSGMSNFSGTISGLLPKTVYYVRAYAINGSGISYGNQESFSTLDGLVSTPGNGISDSDGNTYPSLVLGNGQEWMGENLRTTKFSNGEPINQIQDSAQWLSNASPAWVSVSNSATFDNPYGKLYNWYTVADARNVCPSGWHVPNDADWSSLVHYVDSLSTSTAMGVQSGTAGGKLKQAGTTNWVYPNTGATDEINFSALPAGMRLNNGHFLGFGEQSFFWSATAADGLNGYGRYLYNDNSSVVRTFEDKRAGGTVRCLKD